MTYKQILLIELLITEVIGKDCLKSEVEDFKLKVSQSVIKDTIDTFEKFGYEMAKGVFKNEFGN